MRPYRPGEIIARKKSRSRRRRGEVSGEWLTGMTPDAESGPWRIFRPRAFDKMRIAVFQESAEFGLMALFPKYSGTSEDLLRDLKEANRGLDPYRSFVFPDTGLSLTYDPRASRRRWVMKTAGGEPLWRDYAAWPRLKSACFTRPPARSPGGRPSGEGKRPCRPR